MSNPITGIIAKKGWCVADGATGSNFFGRGLEAGYTPDLWCVEKPEEVLWLHGAIFKDAIDNAPTQDSFKIYKEIVSLTDQKKFIVESFEGNEVVSLKKIVKKLETKIEIIVTFLALLEMIKQSEILCTQKKIFQDIEIKLTIAKA